MRHEEAARRPKAPERKRMSRPYDARALRSREALKAALMALLQKQAFDQISVRDITAAAGVSYPVFFRRYSTKEELLDDIATSEVRDLFTLTLPIFDATHHDESLHALCAFVNEHRSLWRGLLTGGGGPTMQQEFRRMAREIGEGREHVNPWLPRDLAAAFVGSGLFEVLAWWLRQPDDYPVENVVKMLNVLIVRSAARPVDVTLTPYRSST